MAKSATTPAETSHMAASTIFVCGWSTNATPVAVAPTLWVSVSPPWYISSSPSRLFPFSERSERRVLPARTCWLVTRTFRRFDIRVATPVRVPAPTNVGVSPGAAVASRLRLTIRMPLTRGRCRFAVSVIVLPPRLCRHASRVFC